MGVPCGVGGGSVVQYNTASHADNTEKFRGGHVQIDDEFVWARGPVDLPITLVAR